MSGAPAWFAGGLAGLIIFIAVIPIMIHKFKVGGMTLSIIGLFLAVMNFLVFEWPLWASITCAAAVFYEAMS